MLDSDESGVTYMEVSSPFEGLSDIGSPRADDHEYLELPGMLEDPYVEAALQAPPCPDYVPSLEEPEQGTPSPDYVPGPEHADDEIVAEDQPYAEDASPTAQSPDYVPESDPEADPEEDDDKDPEEYPVDYPANRGDDGDDEGGVSEVDVDDDLDIKARSRFSFPAPSTTTSLSHTSSTTIATTISASRREDRPRLPTTSKRLGIVLVLIELRLDIGITDSWDEIVEDPSRESPVSTDTVVGSTFDSICRLGVRQHTDVDFTRDRRAHAYTRHQMETEARDCPERLGGDRWMREIGCDFRSMMKETKRSAEDERVEDN
ncbi:hypothetical protein Tco_1394014 [Tanacetum coccineum]